MQDAEISTVLNKANILIISLHKLLHRHLCVHVLLLVNVVVEELHDNNN